LVFYQLYGSIVVIFDNASQGVNKNLTWTVPSYE